MMAIAVIATAMIAMITLTKSRESRREELSTKLVNIWIERKYEQKYFKLNELNQKLNEANKLRKTEKEEELNIEVERLMVYGSELYAIEYFIYKLNYYLDSGQLSLKNIDIDFSEIFGFNDLALQSFYSILKRSQNKVGSIFGKDNENIIDKFFLKFAEYKGFKSVISDIKNSFFDSK